VRSRRGDWVKNRALALPPLLISKFGRADYIFAPAPEGKVTEGGLRQFDYIRPLATIEPTAIRLGLPVCTDFRYKDIAETMIQRSSIGAATFAAATSATSTRVFDAIGIEKKFDDGQVQALRDVNLQVMQGELLAITDPSGCGKTTLLQMLGALDRPTAGTLLYRGKSIPNLPDPSNYRTREIGFIFQAFHLLPTFTALENVQIPMLETEIIEFDGKSVTDSRHLRLMVAEKPPGSNVSVKVFRDGKEQTFTVELGTLPSEDLFQPGGSSDAWR